MVDTTVSAARDLDQSVRPEVDTPWILQTRRQNDDVTLADWAGVTYNRLTA